MSENTKINVQQAIEEGYEYYMYVDEDFQAIKCLKDISGDSYRLTKILELVEKEPYHPASIDEDSILEYVGGAIWEQHNSECGDDTDNIVDAINLIDKSTLKPFLDAVAEKLQGLNYYRGSGIELTVTE